MNKTILILAIIAVLLIAYVAMKSEKTTVEHAPAISDTAIVQTDGTADMPIPDAIDEVIIMNEEMPDPQDVSPIDEETAPVQGETIVQETEVISVQ